MKLIGRFAAEDHVEACGTPDAVWEMHLIRSSVQERRLREVKGMR